MKTEFIIKNGTLLFNESLIQIHDRSKTTQRYYNIAAIVWIFYGILSIIRFYKTNVTYMLWSGIIIVLCWLAVAVSNLRKNYANHLMLSDVDKVIIKEDLLGRLKAVFILKSTWKKRSIILDPSSSFDFEDALKAHNISFKNQ